MSAIIDSADEFFGLTAAAPYEDVELPGGKTMRVRGLTAAERDEVEFAIGMRRQQRAKARKAGKRVPADIPFRASLVVRATIRKDGTPIFKPGDVQRVAEMPSGVVSPLSDAIIRLSAMRAEDIEELTENFDETGDDDSSSSSPSLSDEPSES